MSRHPTPLQVITNRARKGGPKEHRAKQIWPCETHSVTYAPGLSTLPYLRLSRSFRRHSSVTQRPPQHHPFSLTLVYLPDSGQLLKPQAASKPQASFILEMDLTVCPESYYLLLLPPSTSFRPHDTHPFFPNVQTISILSDLLYR